MTRVGTDDDAPVLVGVAGFSHRAADGPTPELVDLMVEAAQRAAADTGLSSSVLRRLGWVGVPKGAWGHADPGRAVATAVGAGAGGVGRPVHTLLAEVGILQQEVLDRACRAVQDGSAEVALVVGAETAYRSTTGAAGAVVEARAAASEPDEHLVSHDEFVSPVEIAARFYDPPTVYATIESAWAASQGWTAAEHRTRLGTLWSGFAAVAAGNPAAWSRDAFSPAAIVEPSDDNRMVAWPYTKRCCSNLRVDQGAALLFTTAGSARRLGIDESRWVFPHGSAVANHAVAVLRRPEPARSPNAAAAGRRALDLAGVGIDEIEHLDLYSCFPAAVQLAAGELGIAARPLTVTGGMTFAGGPLNSYGLHSTAAMADVLRADPGSRGLVTSVSGFVTKYGAGVWSTAPPATPWQGDDVTADAAELAGPAKVEVDAAAADVAGKPLRVVAATVEHTRDGGRRAVVLADVPDGRRTIVTEDGDAATALADAIEAGDLIGTTL